LAVPFRPPKPQGLFSVCDPFRTLVLVPLFGSLSPVRPVPFSPNLLVLRLLEAALQSGIVACIKVLEP
jgi:hypothetical protein